MKWIYNPNSNELINTDTGAMIILYSWGWAKSAKYDFTVQFRGPAGGYSPQTEGVESHQSDLYSGTEPECQAYLRDLAGQFDAFALPEGHGAPRPKQEAEAKPTVDEADYIDIPF